MRQKPLHKADWRYRELRAQLWIWSDRHCWYCGNDPGDNSLVRRTLDHIIPVSQGGSDDYDNILPACIDCNIAKHRLRLSDFRGRRGQLFWGEVNGLGRFAGMSDQHPALWLSPAHDIYRQRLRELDRHAAQA